jgi:hypothetical protein
MNSLFRLPCFLALISVSGLAHADEVGKIFEAIPTEVTDVVSGGSWSKGAETGEFRAITVTQQVGDTTQASVAIQILVIDKATSKRKVKKTVPLKEINDKKLASADLAMNVENDNEVELSITYYDAEKDKDQELTAKCDSIGKCEIKEKPSDSKEAQDSEQPAE